MQSPSFGLAGLGLRCCEHEDVRSIAGLQFRGSSQNRLLAESVGISFRPSYNMERWLYPEARAQFARQRGRPNIPAVP